MYSPRIAHLRLTNKPRNFRAFDTDVYTHQHQTSSGGNSGVGTSRLRDSWGPLSRFFREFLHVRVVDLETHMVLFTGQIYKIKNKYEGERGAIVELECRDSLAALQSIKLKILVNEIDFPIGTRRSDVIQQLLKLGYDYLGARGGNNPDDDRLEPSLSTLQGLQLTSSKVTLNSNNRNTGASAANTYNRMERSEKAFTETHKWKASKSGSSNLLQEITKWAILEPHEDETQIDQFGYDFFADPNIGQYGLASTTPPQPQMFNYYKRGNRLSGHNSSNQQADVYGLTVKLPVLGSQTPHQGAAQLNVGTLGGAINASATAVPIASAANAYAGQVITIDSEQLLVKQIHSPDEGGNDVLEVIRGWDGSTAASHSNSAVIKEIRPAHAVMHRSFDFDDADDELYTEAVLDFVQTYTTPAPIQAKMERERQKRFEILYVTEISGAFTWPGKLFDDWQQPSTATPGTVSAEEFTLHKPGVSQAVENSADNNAFGRIQYQSTASNTGSTNFAYILISDLHEDFPTANYDSDAYVEIKGISSSRTCRVNLNATEAIQGRPATAWAGGNTSSDNGRFLRRTLEISRQNIEEIDELRNEIAARLARGTNPLKRGNFQMSKAPYYWYDGIINTATNVTGGQQITVKAQNGSAAVNVTNYGVREGMVVHKMTSGYAGIAQANSKDVYGYIWSMGNDYTFNVDLTETQTFAADDLIRIYVPLRAGDTVKVDNILADIYGEHLITKLSFTEDPNPRTSFDTVGENEPRIRLKHGNVARSGQSVWNKMLSDKSNLDEKINLVAPTRGGNQPFKWTGTWTFTDHNTITWNTNTVTLADGTSYQVLAGSTNDATYGLNGDMAGSNRYVLYLDPEGENPGNGLYHIYTAFVQDADNLLFMYATPTSSGNNPDCIQGPNFQNTIVLPHSDLDASGKANPPTVDGTAPSSPAVGDIWIDTDTTNNWKRWNGSAWVTYDLGTAAAIGTAAQGTANTANTAAGNAQNTADAKRTVFRQAGNPDTGSGAPTALSAGDVWFHTDGANTTYGQKIFTASGTGTGNWQLRDDAGAINNASTNIEGGRIETQTIVLKSGGGGQESGGATNGVLHTAAVSTSDGSANASRVILSHTGIFGYNSSGNFEFKLTTADGKGTFGGGNSSIGAAGINLNGEATSVNFMHDEGYFQMWGSETTSGSDQLRRIFFNSKNSGDSYQTDPEINFLAPHSPGTLGLGHHALGPWGTIYANVHYLDIKGSAPSAATESGWGAMYIRGTNVYVKIGSTEYTVSGGGSGDIEGVNITAGTHLSGDQNTSSGTHTQTIDHLVANGSYHLPINGAANQLLVYSGSSGQATWQDPDDHGTHGGGGGSYTHPDPIRLGDGSAAAPTYSFTADTNTGLFRESNDIVAFGVNGQNHVAIDGNSSRAALRLDGHYSFLSPNMWDYPAVYYQGDRDTGFFHYDSGSNHGTIFVSDSNTKMIVGYSSTYAVSITGGLTLSGALSKGSGTFKIAHPLDETNKTLVHGFVESPRYDLIYRGTATLSSGTATVSIDTASNLTIGTFEALTKNPEIWLQNKTGWVAVKGTVDGGNVIITAQDSSCEDTIAWAVMAERNDTFIKSSAEPWTDEDGTFIAEHNNSDLNEPILPR